MSGLFLKKNLARALASISCQVFFLKTILARALASSGVGAQAAVDSLSRQLRFVHHSNDEGGDGGGQHVDDDDGNGNETLFGTS